MPSPSPALLPPVRRVVLVAPGRSGSTLLQSAFLASCERTLTFFEPCRHAPDKEGGEAVFKQACVAQVLRFLSCELPQTPAGQWSPTRLRAWLRHPYVAANASCAAPPFASVRQTISTCQQAPVVVVKEIRLVGQLSLLADALEARASKTREQYAIVHLVRDPLPMLASQRRLQWWGMVAPTGNNDNNRSASTSSSQQRKQQRKKMERVAKRTCRGMVADAKVGSRLQRQGGKYVRYTRVRFEDLTSRLNETVAWLYRDLGIAMLPSTHEWVERTLQGRCANGGLGDGGRNATMNFEYGTCRHSSSPRRDWRNELPELERQVISRQCKRAMATFGYAGLQPSENGRS